jgi:prevent-host-death family protein
MARRVSAKDARMRFAEITNRVHYTGEPIILEKQGHPFVAVVSLEDLDKVERLRRGAAASEFERLAREASRSSPAEPSEEEIVAAVNRTRRELYRERYAGR